MKKAQITIEFIFGIGALVMIFVLLLHLSFERRIDILNLKEDLDALEECHKFSSIISEVYNGGDGTKLYTKTDYKIDIKNQIIEVVKENLTKAMCPIYARIQNVSFSGEVLVKNEKGTIAIQ